MFDRLASLAAAPQALDRDRRHRLLRRRRRDRRLGRRAARSLRRRGSRHRERDRRRAPRGRRLPRTGVDRPDRGRRRRLRPGARARRGDREPDRGARSASRKSPDSRRPGPDLRLEDGNATYLAVSLGRRRRRREDAAEPWPRRSPASRASRSAASPRSSRSANRSRATCSGPSCSPSRSCSSSRCSSSAASSPRCCRCWSAALAILAPSCSCGSRASSTRDLDLRAQPRHRPRPRTRDRLQPLHRLALPRGDRQVGPGLEAMRRDDGDRRPHGPLLLADGRRRARLAAVFPQNFLYSMGLGGSLVALIAAVDLADRPAGDPRAARQPRQLACAGVPAAARRRRRAARQTRASGTGSPQFVLRRAGTDRGDQRSRADRPRDPVPRDQVHLR